MGSVGGGGGGRDGARLARLPDGSFGWRRRAVLLLQPGMAAMVESGGTVPLVGTGGGTLLPMYSPREVQALLAMALAPMVLPGGGGWRVGEQQQQQQGVTTGVMVNGTDMVTGGSSKVGAGSSSGSNGLAVADAVTAVALADVAPSALMGRLPLQLAARWERLYRALSRVAVGAAVAGDRAALVVVQDLATCVTAIYKSVALSGSEGSGFEGRDGSLHGLSASCPPAHELLSAARAAAAAGTLPPLLDLSAPLTAPLPAVDAHALALARIAALDEWAGSEECGELLGGGGAGPLRRVVQAHARS